MKRKRVKLERRHSFIFNACKNVQNKHYFQNRNRNNDLFIVSVIVDNMQKVETDSRTKSNAFLNHTQGQSI